MLSAFDRAWTGVSVGYKLAVGTAPAAPNGPALPDKPSLVVLHFANISGTAENA